MEDQFFAYLPVNMSTVGICFLFPAVIYTITMVIFGEHASKFNYYSSFVFGNLVCAIGLFIMGPFPTFSLVKDSIGAWLTQIIGAIFLAFGVGVSFVPSMPAMKQSVRGKVTEDVENLIGSTNTICSSLGQFIGKKRV